MRAMLLDGAAGKDDRTPAGVDTAADFRLLQPLQLDFSLCVCHLMLLTVLNNGDNKRDNHTPGVTVVKTFTWLWAPLHR